MTVDPSRLGEDRDLTSTSKPRGQCVHVVEPGLCVGGYLVDGQFIVRPFWIVFHAMIVFQLTFSHGALLTEPSPWVQVQSQLLLHLLIRYRVSWQSVVDHRVTFLPRSRH
jgi:hypothetical protein